MESSFFSWLGIVVQFALIKCSLSIRLLQVTVPSVIQAGETATLQCIFDLEQDRLYSVKWYKDNVEFFRFIPKLDPPIATYVVDGLRVDETSDTETTIPPPAKRYKTTGSSDIPRSMNALQMINIDYDMDEELEGASPTRLEMQEVKVPVLSPQTQGKYNLVDGTETPVLTSPVQFQDNHHIYLPSDNNELRFERSSSDQNVVLPNVGLPSSGHYKCEVSAEAPSFVSVSGGGVIEVVVLPQGKPSITGGQSKYQVGDYVDINCTSAPSKPPAILNWYINGKQAQRKVLKQYKTVVGTNNLESTVLGLSFRVEEHHVLKSSLLLKCASSVGSLTKGSFDLEDLGEKISDINNHEKIEAQVGWPSLSESEVLHIANSSSHSFLSLVLISTTIFSTLFIL